MSSTSQCHIDGRFNAVVRSYQPCRIERELLAQVFDLAKCAIQSRSEVLTESWSDADQVRNSAHSEVFPNEYEQPSSHLEIESMKGSL